MDRDTAVKTWREVCGSDTVMAMGVVTGRMLEEFARRIEAAEHDPAAKARKLETENKRLRKALAPMTEGLVFLSGKHVQAARKALGLPEPVFNCGLGRSGKRDASNEDEGNDMTITAGQRAQFEALSRPLIQWLNDNCHPHTTIVIESDSAEVLEGMSGFKTTEYIKD